MPALMTATLPRPEDQQLVRPRTLGKDRLASLVDRKREGGEAFLEGGSGVDPHGMYPLSDNALEKPTHKFEHYSANPNREQTPC